MLSLLNDTSTGKKGWQEVMRQSFTRLDRFIEFLALSEAQRAQVAWHPSFSLQVPMRLANKMAKGSLEDPLVRQFLPLQNELVSSVGFIADPVSDMTFRKEKKLLHKYQGRALLVCTSACAMHCRYCFRQQFPYANERGFEAELAHIANDLTIHEVILSGGDPLSLSDAVLGSLLASLSACAHVQRIRFHTRFPIGIPERIDESFLKLLSIVRPQLYMVIHCNHPRELDDDLFDRLHALQRLGCVVLNQAVLLKGVNDHSDTLRELAEQLANHGVLFYYLHQLDRVQGSAHFEVDEEEGRALIRNIARSLPGYAVPKYVREIAGEPNKTPL